MQIDVTQLIADLLYEYDSVSIPSFGGLTTAYRSAELDQVSGKLLPPTKELSFNENIVVNDGLLIGQLQERFGLSQADAEVKLNLFVEQLKARLDRGEEVSFPNLGKFYIGANQNISFVPQSTNFNTDAYGLPEVQFYPVSKAGVKPAFEKTETLAAKTFVQEREPNTWLYWLIMVLGILALAMIIYSNRDHVFPSSGDGAEDTDPEAAVYNDEKPSERVNVPPIGEDELILEDDKDKEVIVAAGQREAIVVVGLYSNLDNVRAVIERIYNMGFEAITDEQGGSQRVSARFAYESEDELNRIHARLKRSFDKNAWILRK